MVQRAGHGQPARRDRRVLEHAAWPQTNKLEAAKALISELLGGGKEHPSTELDEAAETAGITLATMKSARKALGVRAWKRDFDGAWMVCLPADPGDGNSDSSPSLAKNPNSSPKFLCEKALHEESKLLLFARKQEESEFIGR
jgi:hypothetical protein